MTFISIESETFARSIYIEVSVLYIQEIHTNMYVHMYITIFVRFVGDIFFFVKGNKTKKKKFLVRIFMEKFLCSRKI